MDIERQNFLNECAEDDQRKIKRFIDIYGSEDAELADIEGIEYSSEEDLSAFSEMAINLGYFWVEKYQRWVKKDNSFYNEEDQRIVEILKNMN